MSKQRNRLADNAFRQKLYELVGAAVSWFNQPFYC